MFPEPTTDLDPELMSWILEFIRQRGRVTREEITQEFFPGDVVTPYLYLDALTAKYQISQAIYSNDANRPGTWFPIFQNAAEKAKYSPAQKKPAEKKRGKPSPSHKYGRFATGTVHTLTAEEISHQFDKDVKGFKVAVRAYARHCGMVFFSTKIPGGRLRFCILPDPDLVKKT
ncbi:hypothetical protein [Streptomyces sp. NPDC057250]|uniref:hypothetical protein n=1 Tax=Streptomyces sp. NPDC057250 TaxID=3346068 RepID=UPI00362F956B